MKKQNFIKLSAEGIPELSIETNDSNLLLSTSDDLINVTEIPRFHDVNKLGRDFDVSVKKNKSGEIEEIIFKVKKDSKKEDKQEEVELNINK